jgi:DinB superfamily
MHPRTEELLEHLQQHHRLLLGELDRVPVMLWQRRPAPASWSVAEVLEHLAIVNGRVARNINDRTGAARNAGMGPDPDRSPVLPTFDRARAVDRTTKMAAPPPVQPHEQLGAAAARERLEVAHAALLDAVRASDGVNLVALTLPHPLFGEMNLYQWIAFAGSHEARHAAQVAEIGAVLGANTGST